MGCSGSKGAGNPKPKDEEPKPEEKGAEGEEVKAVSTRLKPHQIIRDLTARIDFNRLQLPR